MDSFLKTGKLGPSAEAEGIISGASSSKDKRADKSQRRGPIPWVEKYRPQTIDEVVYQDEVVSVMKKILQGADLPNLLFYGSPGTGKTSTILAAARELFGNHYKDRVMELNASDERGIQVIREKVKRFAQTSVSSIKINGKMCPPYKIIILDEADSMTSDAQAALRRTMESESKSTRFCLLCNYISRIIDPLTSRCSKFRFKPLAHDVLVRHLTQICQNENVKCSDEALGVLIETSEGDLRRAITSLQSVARFKAGNTITEEDIYEVTGVIPDAWLQGLFEVCRSDSYDKLSDYVDEFILNGYSAAQFLSQVHDAILTNDDFSEEMKSAILERLVECDYRLCTGANEYLQVMDLSCIIMQQTCHPKLS